MTYEDLDELGCDLTERIREAATTAQVDELLRLKDAVNLAKRELNREAEHVW